MSEFGPAYKAMRLIEGNRHGGYVHDPDDLGGETYAGIARRFHPKADIWVLVDGAKKKPGFPASLDTPALREQLELAVADFYFVEFWKRGQFDLITDQALADELFEEAVNLDVPEAVENLQKALNKLNLFGKRWPEVAEDGKPGPSTAYAVTRASALGMAGVVRKACNIYQGYKYLCSKQEKFIRGWLDARVSL